MANYGSDNWLNFNPSYPTAQGSANDGGGGYGKSMAISYRDSLDAARSGAFGSGRTGDATYPDGYLADNGAIGSRREDKLGQPVLGEINKRGYQRGVHKGTKMDPGQYYWPKEFNLDSRLAAERRAKFDPMTGLFQVKRQVPAGVPVGLMIYPGLTNLPDDGPAPTANVASETVDPAEAAYLARDLVGGLNVKGVR
jgi:hypothetical protein